MRNYWIEHIDWKFLSLEECVPVHVWMCVCAFMCVRGCVCTCVCLYVCDEHTSTSSYDSMTNIWNCTFIVLSSVIVFLILLYIVQVSLWASCQIRKIAVFSCAGNAWNLFPATDFNGNRQLAIMACITARASRTCRDACRFANPRWRENVTGIPGACPTRNFTYLIRGPLWRYTTFHEADNQEMQVQFN